MKTRTLTTQEAVALWNWAVSNRDTNWGTWSGYPLRGCSFLQFDTNPIVVKFDELTTFGGETFKRIGWSRQIPGKENAITFSALYDLIPIAERPAKEMAPDYEFQHPNGNVFFLKQSKYADYKNHTFSVRFPNGEMRDDFTNQSKMYAQMMECKPAEVVIF